MPALAAVSPNLEIGPMRLESAGLEELGHTRFTLEQGRQDALVVSSHAAFMV